MLNTAQRDLLARFTVEQTGGNCQALVLKVDLPSTKCHEVWITDGNLGVDFEHMCEDCMVEVGWYEDDLAVSEGCAMDTAAFPSLDEALDAVAEWLRSVDARCPVCGCIGAGHTCCPPDEVSR